MFRGLEQCVMLANKRRLGDDLPANMVASIKTKNQVHEEFLFFPPESSSCEPLQSSGESTVVEFQICTKHDITRAPRR